jgi:hypothetical protein
MRFTATGELHVDSSAKSMCTPQTAMHLSP